MKRFAALGIVILVVSVVTPAGADLRERVRRPGPVRVLLVGDSITGNYAPEAAARLRARGYVVMSEGRPSSGLLDEDRCSGAYARFLLDAFDPDIVVYENVGNYAGRVGVDSCTHTAYGSPTFYRRWTKSARLQQRILRSRGAEFFWMLAPAVDWNPAREAAVPMLNSIYEDIGNRKVDYIDAWDAFGGETFNAPLHSDGMHLNDVGAKEMASLVVDATAD